MTRIYSDIEASVQTTEGQDKVILITDHNGSRYRPNLILPNILAVWKMRNYLDKVVKDNADYCERAGIPTEVPEE